jgi:cytochrome c553
MKRTVVILSLLSWLVAASRVEAAAPTPAQLEFFEQRIRPMLANECYECHGAQKQKGKLRVDSRDGLLKGGSSGSAIIPGDAKKSLLIQSIRHDDPDSAMPKDRPKLSYAVIADFVKWVNDGAPDPRDQPASETSSGDAGWDATFKARKDWWSFKPVQKVAPPAVTNTAWSAHPVDQFLLAKIEERGLQPASPADRRTLIRRLTFTLTGLPPTTDEVQAFLNDASPDAYAKVVERLLGSPRFGEHWARHWMDLMRFAETHGSEGDPEIPNAWRYRDYLIRAFNSDVRWNQLIREHLAGDLLAKPRWNEAEGINESLLGLAHFRLVEHGFNPVDTLDEQIKTVDSQIDVVSKAFQGLTTSCARCHNHKFDPISERDYYALHGIFASVRPTQLTIDQPERLRVHRDELTKLKRSIKKGVAETWEKSARELTENLLQQAGGTNRPAIPGDEIQTRIGELEKRIAAIDQAGRAEVLRTRGLTNTPATALLPMAAWTFDTDARDALGGLHGELQGGAVIRNGRLVVDGKGAFLRTAPLECPLSEKTLEAWVTLANLEQGGGGVLTVESQDGAVFDSIVFAEKEPRKWMAGSTLYQRGKNLKALEESAKLDELVHIAIVYRADNSIAIFRNGVAYGAVWTPSGEGRELQTYAAKSARVLLGQRHTGGGSAFFAGEIEEARIYDRALTAKEVKASFSAGPGLISPAAIAQALTPEQQAERARLTAEIASRRAVLVKQFPDYAERQAARARWLATFNAAATNQNHPLAAWFQLRDKSAEAFTTDWQSFVQKQTNETAARQKFNAETFQPAWDFRGNGVKEWFRHGVNPPVATAKPGEFAVEPEGERIFSGLLPAGVFSHLLSQKHNGVFASPRFKITSDNISVRVIGGKGAGVRLVLDNYPLGQGNIYPAADLKSDAPTWVRIDVAYRKGSTAYLEFAPSAELTSRNRGPAGPSERSFFGVERVVFHDAKTIPKDEITPNTLVAAGDAPKSAAVLAKRLGEQLATAIAAWRIDSMSEEQCVFLDAFLRGGLLPMTVKELPEVASLVAAYRKLEADIPSPRRAPGVLETVAYNAPLLSRGDHLKPLAPEPRGYLQLVSARRYETKLSGRLELANDITSAANPLTSRVLVNRVWHHLFGRGLVGTVDNFGRLGERPSHPELLDFLATRFTEKGWSSKELIRYLVTTRAYQMSSEVSARAAEIDPDNLLLSHARTRRVEAESIRDALLAISGRLDTNMFGLGVNALAAPAQQRRRSVYLMVRRNFLSPFLETFDAPKPFTTLGKRDVTNVPAQSLALLNDPFVIEQAAQWADIVLAAEPNAEARVRRMFEMAFARLPNDAELVGSRAYLADLAREHGEGKDKLVWRDFAQSLFNLKEFIYIR